MRLRTLQNLRSEQENLSIIRVDEDDFLGNVLKDLYKQKIQSVFVEGGAITLNLFIERGWWDEARIFQSPKIFEKGIAAPLLRGKLTGHHTLQSDNLRILVR